MFMIIGTIHKPTNTLFAQCYENQSINLKTDITLSIGIKLATIRQIIRTCQYLIHFHLPISLINIPV